MTITTTQIGTNTYQITLDDELNPNGVIAAVDAAIIAGGWTLHDAYNENTHRVYRNLCKDGQVFKYLGIFIDIATFKIYTTVYETWDNSTHTGTNEAYTHNRSGCMGFTLTACDIIVMTSPRWCILQTFIRNSPSPWSGIVECVREATEDTVLAGYPPFAWACSLFISNNINGHKYLSFPRNRAGYTGALAVADGIQTPFARFGATTGMSGHTLIAQPNVYPWDTSKKLVHSMRPTFGFAEVHGKVFGLKAAHNIGSPFNRVSMPIDSDYHYLSTGTETEHWVLGNTASPTSLSSILITGAPASGYHSGLSSASLPGAVRYSIFTGAAYYATYSSGICRIDATSSTLGVVKQLSGVTADHGDIVYDGRYAYAASAAGITRVDTTDNDAITTLALPQGCMSMFWDGTWLWASARTTLVNNAFYKINPATFTISSTLTQINAAGHTICGIVNDFAGNLYTVSSDGKTNKIVISTGIVSAMPSLVAANIMCGIIYNGVNLYAGFAVSNGSTIIVNTSASPGYGENLTTTGGTFSANQTTGCGKLVLSKIHNVFLSSVPMNTAVPHYLQSGKSSSSFGGVNAVPNQPFSVTCDGARVYGSNGSTFYQYTGICHPDDGAAILNRLLLPK